MKLAALALISLVACGGGGGTRATSAAPPVEPSPSPPPSNRMRITVLDAAPPDALALRVDAIRWTCTITMPGGASDDELHVPTGRAIRLVLSTRDQADGIEVALVGTTAKRAVRFGETTELVFRIDQPGTYQWICPSLLPPGDDPATRMRPLHAEPPATYAAYLRTRQELAGPTTRDGRIAAGKQIFERKACIACHTVDGSRKIGVTMAGLWGTTVELVDGSRHVVDAEFIERALNDPNTYRRAGYPPSMPSYAGQLTDDELASLAAYIESLAHVKAPPPDIAPP